MAGFDVMEVSSAYDHAEITALLAATLVSSFLMSRLEGDGYSRLPSSIPRLMSGNLARWDRSSAPLTET